MSNSDYQSNYNDVQINSNKKDLDVDMVEVVVNGEYTINSKKSSKYAIRIVLDPPIIPFELQEGYSIEIPLKGKAFIKNIWEIEYTMRTGKNWKMMKSRQTYKDWLKILGE